MHSNQRISAVIAHVPDLPNTDQALEACINSLKGHTELIVVVNDGWGYGRSYNLGMRASTGDFLCIINNDTELIEGSLQDLARVEAVTVPVIVPPAKDHNPRCFFCVPRWVYREIGGFDEQFGMGYWEDDDLIKRLEVASIPVKLVESVVVSHRDGGGMTIKNYGEQYWHDRNKELFERKWS